MADAGAGAASATARRSWRDAAAVYLHRRVLAMLFLGFSAGLPFLLVFATLSAWLREAGIGRTAIGFLSWIGITYSIKFLWAPVVDRLPLPGLTAALGRRRSWMLVAMIGIAGGLAGMALVDPGRDLAAMAGIALIVAFASATQDVAIDAYRIEAVAGDLQGAMAATYQLGYRAALLAAGAGALYLAEYVSWPAAYLTMAALALVGIVTVLAIAEPETRPAPETAAQEARVAAYLGANPGQSAGRRRLAVWFIGAVICPVTDFLSRAGRAALPILLFVGLFRLSDLALASMAYPFYIDLGFSKAEIASVIKLFGFFMTVAGAFLGGMLVARYGVLRPLLLGAAMVAATNLLFALLAVAGRDLALLTVVISADNISAGLAGAAFIAYLSNLTSTAYTATQYALFSSLMTLPGKFVGGFSGIVVDTADYAGFFLYAAALGLPAIALILHLMRREKRTVPVGESL